MSGSHTCEQRIYGVSMCLSHFVPGDVNGGVFGMSVTRFDMEGKVWGNDLIFLNYCYVHTGAGTVSSRVAS